ncbi:MAG TPA: tetratricopeptide repeat protein [Saprospiraceae bacterium]|nr:tetratricopeptide repeat protein [Saprospiraceae bacterium]
MKSIFTSGIILCLFLPARNYGQVSISLSANYGQGDTIYLDELILLQVTLANAAADWQQAWNLQAQAHLDDLKSQFDNKEISEEYLQKETQRISRQRKEPSPVTVGNNNLPWHQAISFLATTSETDSLILQLIPFAFPVTESIVMLDENTRPNANFGLEPLLSPGQYSLQAKIDSSVSEPVSLLVLADNTPTSVSESEEMLARRAGYYLLKPDYHHAAQEIERMLVLYPGSLIPYRLRGDLFSQQELWEKALSDYEMAIKLFHEKYPDSYESPVYLDTMIWHCKKKLGQE